MVLLIGGPPEVNPTPLQMGKVRFLDCKERFVVTLYDEAALGDVRAGRNFVSSLWSSFGEKWQRAIG